MFELTYRPQTFSEVIGQSLVIEALTKDILNDEIRHAYLFGGPWGVGKTSVARVFSKAIMCPNRAPDAIDGCGECPICKSVEGGGGLDYLEIDAATNRGIDDIRALRDQSHFMPVTGALRKVVVLDEAGRLTIDANNALLKILEEGSQFVFLLVTTEPERIVKTVHSRSLILRFQLIEQAQVVKRLESICQQEGLDYVDSALTMLAMHSAGHLRDAIKMLALFDGKVTEDLVREKLRIVPETMILKILQSLDGQRHTALVRELQRGGYDFLNVIERLLDFLVYIIRDEKEDNLTPDEARSVYMACVRFLRLCGCGYGPALSTMFEMLLGELAYLKRRGQLGNRLFFINGTLKGETQATEVEDLERIRGLAKRKSVADIVQEGVIL